MQSTSAPQVFLFGHKALPSLLQGLFFSMQMGGLGLENGVPYQQKGLSTLVSRVSRRPEEQGTSFNQSIPRRFYTLASRHSTSGLHTSAERKIVCINVLPYLKMESLSSPCASERATKMWTRACNLPVPRRFSCLATKRTKTASGFFFFNANERGGLEERRPILTNVIVDACLACQSTARRT